MRQESVYFVTIFFENEEYVVLGTEFPDYQSLSFDTLEEAKVMIKDEYRVFHPPSSIKEYPGSFEGMLELGPVIVELPKDNFLEILTQQCLGKPVSLGGVKYGFRFPVIYLKMNPGFTDTYLRLRVLGDEDKEQYEKRQEVSVAMLDNNWDDEMELEEEDPELQPFSNEHIAFLMSCLEFADESYDEAFDDSMGISITNNLFNLKRLFQRTDNVYYIIVFTVQDREFMIIDENDHGHYVWRYNELSDAKEFFRGTYNELYMDEHPYTYYPHLNEINMVNPEIVMVPKQVDVINDWVIEENCIVAPSTHYFGGEVCYISLKPGCLDKLERISIQDELNKIIANNKANNKRDLKIAMELFADFKFETS